MARFRSAPGTRQVLDTGSATSTFTGGQLTSADVLGTKWPLLPNQTLKIFNIGVIWFPDTDLNFTVYNMQIALNFLDGSGASLKFPDGNAISLILAYWNAPPAVTASTITSNDGFQLAADGDPIIEVFSNMQMANIPVQGAGVSAVQLIATIDATNGDSMADHTLNGDLTALLSFESRS